MKYTEAELEVVVFTTEDVITASNGDDYEEVDL